MKTKQTKQTKQNNTPTHTQSLKSLSQSILWEQLRNYYVELGSDVWKHSLVPSQITSNRYLAKWYVQLISAQIQDYYKANPMGSASDEPFYILEIGAGQGKFSFYMQQALVEMLELYNLPPKTCCYIMSDISEENIHSWLKQPAFKPFIEAKTLAFANFNVLTDDRIDLKSTIIEKKDLKKPLFVCFNYIFDTLPHDAFQIKNKQLYESELSIRMKKNQSGFENHQYYFRHHPINTHYYSQSHLNTILQEYQSTLTHASFLMPVGAIQAIENIIGFSQSSTFLLVADKGSQCLDFFEGLEDPDIAYHGSLSMMVNFHALARYTQLQKGQCWLMKDSGSDFQVAAFSYHPAYPSHHTDYVFYSERVFNVKDFFHLAYKNDAINTLSSLDEILAILHLSDWDPDVFYDYHEKLLAYAEKNLLTLSQNLAIKQGLRSVWLSFFRIDPDQDLPFVIANSWYTLSEPKQAIAFYRASLKHFGPSEQTYYNMALAYQALKNKPQAKKCALQANKINQSFKPAKRLLASL